MHKLKIVTIGGGSSYTPELVDGFIRYYSELPVTDYYFVDIDSGKEKMEITTKLVKRMLDNANISINIHITTDLDEALAGAQYVTTQIRVGGGEARIFDEKLSFEHGVLGQETNGPAGFASSLRTIPVLLNIAKKMERLCPDAWMINFTNPAGIVTEAVTKYSTIKSVGICSGANNMRRDIAAMYDVSYKDVDVRVFGINHFIFANSIVVGHVDKTKEILDALAGNIASGIKNKNNIPNEVGKTFAKALKLYPLSGYAKYTYFETENVKFYTEDSKKNGTRGEQILPIEKRLFEIYQQEDMIEKPKELSQRGGSLYSDTAVAIINAIHNDKNEIHVANVPNKGAITDIEYDGVIECSCLVGRSGVQALTVGRLPLSIRGIIQHTKAYEALTVEAAVTGNYDTALLALVNNPLVHSVETARNMLDIFLKEHKKYLDNFYRDVAK